MRAELGFHLIKWRREQGARKQGGRRERAELHFPASLHQHLNSPPGAGANRVLPTGLTKRVRQRRQSPLTDFELSTHNPGCPAWTRLTKSPLHQTHKTVRASITWKRPQKERGEGDPHVEAPLDIVTWHAFLTGCDKRICLSARLNALHRQTQPHGTAGPLVQQDRATPYDFHDATTGQVVSQKTNPKHVPWHGKPTKKSPASLGRPTWLIQNQIPQWAREGDTREPTPAQPTLLNGG